jgi:hypothetical protein
MTANIHLIEKDIKGTFNTGVLATGFNTVLNDLTGAMPTGNPDTDGLYQKTIKELYKKYYQYGLTGLIKDETDAGFFPLTLTGFFS